MSSTVPQHAIGSPGKQPDFLPNASESSTGLQNPNLLRFLLELLPMVLSERKTRGKTPEIVNTVSMHYVLYPHANTSVLELEHNSWYVSFDK
jgi:hypothetical protein